MKLKELNENDLFRFNGKIRNTLNGVYIRGREVFGKDYIYVHEVGIPLDVFVSPKDTEVELYVEK